MIPNSLESRLISVLNSQSGNFAKDELYSYESIFITKIQPDESNPRFFPSIIISDIHAYQFSSRQLSKKQLINIYGGEDNVLIGKSCIVNCFKYGSSQWIKASKSIESILELAENVAVSEIIQVPTIYPIDNQLYRILTGHRRFFAMVYNDGIDGAAHFKVYNTKPLLLKTKQFQENASREELPQYGKLIAFLDALNEVEILNKTKQKLGKKTLTVRDKANFLGISMGTFDNYNVLTRYPSVIKSFEDGNSEPLLKVKKLVLKTERAYQKRYNKTNLNIEDKNKINNLLSICFESADQNIKFDEPRVVSKPKVYKLGNIESSNVIKTLLTTNICELQCGVDWSSIDWNNPEELNDALKIVVEYLYAVDSKQQTT
ncbi:ParB/Srx family N-terminal domain-containing protein [Pseudoalteromonas prydzensis]|uniref:ParB/Srx family N-terminal domain-containing protein n=1 Tax=Pseudoalteromonas prydzensis TaxID=182141 RepID=UPI000A9FB8D9|nr:ParB/Srx family N-terminal domain-containing protein [Pseudoalteromonas prydzensis]MBE0377173.1 hypothetical protein [Pseudoalteromonas prydzensis ACAM 620]